MQRQKDGSTARLLNAARDWRVALAVMASFWATPSAGAQPTIEWHVAEPFRLFTGGAAVNKQIGQLLEALTSAPTISEVSGQVIGELRADRQLPGETLYDHTHFNAATGVYDKDYVAPRAETIVAKLSSPPASATCIWKLDGVPVGAPQACGVPMLVTVPFDPGRFVTNSKLIVQLDATTSYSQMIVSRDVLVLGLGDSYASGEGNPDRPADMTAVKPIYADAVRPYGWWHAPVGVAVRFDVIDAAKGADWWSPECHRSLISPQVLAAMRLAATKTHDSITFLSFACSGAAVLDGLLDPQRDPPGKERLQAIPAAAPNHLATIASERSQLDQAIDALCSDGRDRADLPLPDGLRAWARIYEDKTHKSSVTIPTCKTFIRQPDLIFITIGGNDVGFAGLGAWAILPDPRGPDTALQPAREVYERLVGPNFALVCPDVPLSLPNDQGESVDDTRCTMSLALNPGAKALIANDLPALLRLANRALVRTGLADQAPIIQEAYPQPMTDEAGLPCGTLKSQDARSPFASDKDRESIWLAFHSLLLWPAAAALDTEVTATRSIALRDGPLRQLDAELLETAKQTDWIVAQASPIFPQHGFCAVSPGGSAAREFDFPQARARFLRFAGWDPHHMKPTDWDAYMSRQRWIRNVDDSLLTEMVSDENGVVLIESMTGTLHPTAEGEAAVADTLFAASQGLPLFQSPRP